MNLSELLDEVQRLEDDGFVVFLKWDGERNSRKKTLVISKPGSDVFVRRDSDDMWSSLESAVMEVHGLEGAEIKGDRTTFQGFPRSVRKAQRSDRHWDWIRILFD